MRRPARSEGGRVRELLQQDECGKTPPHAGGEEQLRRLRVVRFGMVRATPHRSQPSLLGPERPGSYLKVSLCDDLPGHRRTALQLIGTRVEPKEALGQMQIRVYLMVIGFCDDLPWHRRIAVQLVGTRAEPKEALSQMQHHRRGTQRNPRRNPTICFIKP